MAAGHALARQICGGGERNRIILTGRYRMEKEDLPIGRKR